MLKKIVQPLSGIIAFWSGVFLIIAALIEWWHRGFVVHFINTRWVVLLFGLAGLMFLVTKEKTKNGE